MSIRGTAFPHDRLLDCVVYLYPTVADAEAGEAIGGTGFLVFGPSVHDGYHFTYCVTNSHVIREGASSVIRLNTADGGMDVIGAQQDDWIHHQDGDDIAICPISMSQPDYCEYVMLSPEMLITRDFAATQHMGPGDEVFMVNRLVTHEGRQRNTSGGRSSYTSPCGSRLMTA